MIGPQNDWERNALRTLNRNVCVATIDLTFREAKAFCGLGSDKLSALRNGKDMNFTAITLLKIANGAGITPAELFRGVE